MPGTRDTGGPTSRRPERRQEAGGQGSAPPLEERTRLELYELASQLGIAGRSDMSKSELIEAIRRR